MTSDGNQSAGLTTTNYGGGRGLELIPGEKTEILVSLPPYITHSSPAMHDGFGDMAFLFKYRAAAGNEKRGNYIVTALFGATVPTGSYSNGATHALLTPSLGLGKGWGDFDVQSTIGVTLPNWGYRQDRNTAGVEHYPAIQDI